MILLVIVHIVAKFVGKLLIKLVIDYMEELEIIYAKQIQDQKVKEENRKKTLKKLEEVREKYFNGKPGCECTKEAMCKECLGRLQADVTKYEQGCGAKWEEEFGGMAAGPAWVTCYDNYFLC